MRGTKTLLLIAGILAAARLAALPVSDKTLVTGTWFLNLGPGSRDAIHFFSIAPEDAKRLYVRRFSTPSFYLDALSGRELKVLIWPDAKCRTLAFSTDNLSLLRETDPIRLEYRRSSAPKDASTPYEGDWEVGDSAMALSIRACEKAGWTIVMYFPGDPLSAIPLGYYPLRPVGEGIYRSSSAFPDSCIELERDPLSSALVIRPLFKERPFAAELYEPVRAWPNQ